jgi:hypothetical protein
MVLIEELLATNSISFVQSLEVIIVKIKIKNNLKL